jgi:protein O-mannosyl-transferase
MPRKPPARKPPTATGGIRWRAALIVLAVVLTYGNSLKGPFILDDEASIVQNTQIREWWRLSEVLLPERDSPVAGRPLVNLSFAFNYAVGGLDVRGYHAINIALHLVCALLAFGLIRRTLDLPHLRGRFEGDSIDLALAAGLLWAVHPLNSEVVDYLTERSESMMAAFCLLTLYAANRALTDSRKRLWLSASVVSCALGMLCKESMAITPVLVALYDRTFAFDTWGDAVRSRTRLYIGLAASWLVLGAIVLTGPRSGVAGFSTGVPIWTYLLNQTGVITHYLRLSIWPTNLVVFYGWPLPLTLGDVLPYAIVMVALIAVTVVALVRVPLLGFLGAWFFITLAPASSVVPVATEVGAERRMYLPLLALVTLAVIGSRVVWKHYQPIRTRAAVPMIALIFSGALAAGTIMRNREYASLLSLAQTVVDRRPTPIAYHILGEQLMLASRDADAEVPLREAVSRGNSRAGFLLGVALLNQGKLGEGVAHLDAFVRTSELPYRLVPRWLEPPLTDVVSARVLMARAFVTEREWSKAAEQAERVLKVAPSNPDAQRLLAEAFIHLGVSRVAAGDLDGAVETFRRAVQLDPANTRARDLLGMALKDQQLAATTR